jgi:prepilin-type N-terminal cleavage/methylation domain-containing protein
VSQRKVNIRLGYTLIEMLVTLALMTLLSGVGIRWMVVVSTQLKQSQRRMDDAFSISSLNRQLRLDGRDAVACDPTDRSFELRDGSTAVYSVDGRTVLRERLDDGVWRQREFYQFSVPITLRIQDSGGAAREREGGVAHVELVYLPTKILQHPSQNVSFHLGIGRAAEAYRSRSETQELTIDGIPKTPQPDDPETRGETGANDAV